MTRYCQGITGNWRIYANYPVILQPALPKRIRWRYGTEAWQEIAGNSYGYTYELNFSFSFVHYQGQSSPCGFFRVYPDITITGTTIHTTTNPSFTDILASAVTKCTLPCLIYGGRDYNPDTIYSIKKKYNNSLIFVNTNVSLQAYFGPFLNFATSIKNYIFNILDAQNNIIYSESRPTQPEVQVIAAQPAICEYKSDGWVYVRSWINSYANGYIEDAIGNNTTTLKFWTGEQEQGEPFLVATFTSDEGCPPPQVRIDCSLRKCPDNTCAILCGNYVCCYDSSGESVDEIPLSEYG